MIKTFTIKELAAANGLSEDTIARRIKRKEINLEAFRLRRFKCPMLFDFAKSAPILQESGYLLPE